MAEPARIPALFRNCVITASHLAASLFAPPRCRLCRQPLFDHNHPFLCPACSAAVEWIGDGACTGCGFPAGPYASHGDSCARCQTRDLSLTKAAAVARYKQGARSLILALKFGKETELAPIMAGLMAERFRSAELGPVDLLVPVPLHAVRRRDRGFDQAGLLGKGIAERLGLQCVPSLLRRNRHTRPQATLLRTARLRNMDEAFTANPAMQGKRILLVDDVMTTGATMAACAHACRAAGATRVYALVFAR